MILTLIRKFFSFVYEVTHSLFPVQSMDFRLYCSKIHFFCQFQLTCFGDARSVLLSFLAYYANLQFLSLFQSESTLIASIYFFIFHCFLSKKSSSLCFLFIRRQVWKPNPWLKNEFLRAHMIFPTSIFHIFQPRFH